MLHFWQDGKEIKINPIYSEGKIGQVVILANVSFGEKPELKKYPLAEYPQPYTFTIIEKIIGADGYYYLQDQEGNKIKIHDPHYGASSSYLYDANAFLAWQDKHHAVKMKRKERKIKFLIGQVNLLKSILINQGFKVVSEKAAKKLGIN